MSTALTFDAGSDMTTEEPFSFTVIDEILCEDDESVRLRGSIVSPAGRGDFVGDALVTITNDDSKWHSKVSVAYCSYLVRSQ